MALIDVVHVMRDAQDRPALVGQAAEQAHHARLGAGVEAAGRLVDVQETWPGQQLGPEADALDLAAAEVGHQSVAVRAQLHLLDDRLNAAVQLGRIGVGRQPQPGGVVERPVDGQQRVNDVLLRDVAERLAEAVEMAIEVLAVGQDLTAGGTAPTVEAVHERAFAGTARPQQADELARLDDQVDAVEQLALTAASQRHDLLQAARLQAQAPAVVQRVNDAFAEGK